MFDAQSLVSSAVDQTGLDDFGGESFREGLERLCESLACEAELNSLGETILNERLRRLLVNRLRIEDAYRASPEIEHQEVEGPIFIIGLPRTGTTALSQLLALDPQVRSLRLWESSDPVPPPETATEDIDPRISETERGLEAMDSAFPRMKSLYFQTATGPTECQDLLGMEMRTTHFDGMAHVPTYTRWAMSCDMGPAYRYHRRTLRLLQWHCPPRLWHLKTPVHMLALGDVISVYPGARFLWTHRDPSQVLGSVCDLISYTRSWVSDRDESAEIGGQQVDIWVEALRRGIAFREKAGEELFADVYFDQLESDPVGTVRRAYTKLGLELGEGAAQRMRAWSQEHHRGAHGAHEYQLDEFGLTAHGVRETFRFYLDRFQGVGGGSV